MSKKLWQSKPTNYIKINIKKKKKKTYYLPWILIRNHDGNFEYMKKEKTSKREYRRYPQSTPYAFNYRHQYHTT